MVLNTIIFGEMPKINEDGDVVFSETEYQHELMMGNTFKGIVDGRGYIRSEPVGSIHSVKQSVPVELPDDLPINTTMKRTYVTVSSLKVRRYSSSGMYYFGNNLTEEQQANNKKIESDNELFRQAMVSLLTTVNTVNSIYGAVKTYQSASTTAVTLGAEYKVINKGGTIVKNTDRVNTTKGKIAGKVANKLAIAGVIIDGVLTVVKNKDPNIEDYERKQNWINFGVNTTVTVGIFIVGLSSAPLAAALGISYLVFSFFSKSPSGYIETDYVKIHGSIAPANNTRVHNPYKR